MTVDTKKLRELAEAATPGPWEAECTSAIARVVCDVQAPLATCGILDEELDARDSANAAFIAAANPQTVVALLDALDVTKNQLGHEIEHSKYLAGCNSSLHSEKEKVEKFLASVRNDLTKLMHERDDLRARCDVLEQECRERERAAEVSAKLLTDQRDEARAQLEQLQPILSVLGDWDWAQVDADGCMDDAAFTAVTRALAYIAKERR